MFVEWESFPASEVVLGFVFSCNLKLEISMLIFWVLFGLGGKEGAPPVHPSHSTENSLWFGWHHHNGMVGRGKSTIIQWPVHVLSVKWIFKQSQPEEETNTKFALSHFQFTYHTCLLMWCGINRQHKWQYPLTHFFCFEALSSSLALIHRLPSWELGTGWRKLEDDRAYSCRTYPPFFGLYG